MRGLNRFRSRLSQTTTANQANASDLVQRASAIASVIVAVASLCVSAWSAMMSARIDRIEEENKRELTQAIAERDTERTKYEKALDNLNRTQSTLNDGMVQVIVSQNAVDGMFQQNSQIAAALMEQRRRWDGAQQSLATAELTQRVITSENAVLRREARELQLETEKRVAAFRDVAMAEAISRVFDQPFHTALLKTSLKNNLTKTTIDVTAEVYAESLQLNKKNSKAAAEEIKQAIQGECQFETPIIISFGDADNLKEDSPLSEVEKLVQSTRLKSFFPMQLSSLKSTIELRERSKARFKSERNNERVPDPRDSPQGDQSDLDVNVSDAKDILTKLYLIQVGLQQIPENWTEIQRDRFSRFATNWSISRTRLHNCVVAKAALKIEPADVVDTAIQDFEFFRRPKTLVLVPQ